MILAVGPLSAAPLTIGETAITGTRAARSAARSAGTARIGSMLSHGFDGAMKIARSRGSSSAVQRRRRRPWRCSAPS